MMISFDINYFLMFQEPTIETALRATPTALPTLCHNTTITIGWSDAESHI
jgi:hypothetical protein